MGRSTLIDTIGHILYNSLTPKNMTELENKNKIAELIAGAKSIAVVPSKVSGVDAFSAGVALYQLLKDTTEAVSFIYTGKVPEGCTGLIKEEEIVSDIFQKELLVTIDYSGTPAAKVHYSTDNEVLHVSVSPIVKEFDLSKVKARVRGFEFDLVFVIGAPYLTDLGQTHRELESDFNGATIVNIDNTETNARYGQVNIVDSFADSLSLLVLNKISQWGLTLSSKAAKALLTGISLNGAKQLAS